MEKVLDEIGNEITVGSKVYYAGGSKNNEKVLIGTVENIEKILYSDYYNLSIRTYQNRICNRLAKNCIIVER